MSDQASWSDANATSGSFPDADPRPDWGLVDLPLPPPQRAPRIPVVTSRRRMLEPNPPTSRERLDRPTYTYRSGAEGSASNANITTEPFSNQSYRLGERRPITNARSLDPSPFEVRRHFLTTAASTAPGVSIDLRELEYIQPFDQNLLCPICHCPFVIPVKVQCDHVFCLDCIGSAMEHQPEASRNCPSCRKAAAVVEIEVVPKLIRDMLDDMMVRCPLASKGCTATITRAAVEDHTTKYCDYHEIECPGRDCSQKIQKRWAAEGRCLHDIRRCGNCRNQMMEYKLTEHQNTSCAAKRASCPDCQSEVPRAELESHRASCPDARVTCSAAKYGCTFSSKVDEFSAHQATCPILMMTPFLEVQRAQLDEHEAAFKQLQRQNLMYRASIANMQEILGLDDSPNPRPTFAWSDSNAQANRGATHPAGHLLALHETLREEVNRVSNAIAALDAKTSTMILNESLRHKDEMAYTNGAIGSVRMQVQWLMSSRQANQTANRGRVAVNRSQPPGEAGPSVLREANDAGSRSGSIRAAGGLGQPARSLSDSARQDPKL